MLEPSISVYTVLLTVGLQQNKLHLATALAFPPELLLLLVFLFYWKTRDHECLLPLLHFPPFSQLLSPVHAVAVVPFESLLLFSQ